MEKKITDISKCDLSLLDLSNDANLLLISRLHKISHSPGELWGSNFA
jgi:hypothetical protein